jgi:hypothetical protein
MTSKLNTALAAAMVVGMVPVGVTTATADPITYAVSLFDDNARLTGFPFPMGVLAIAGSITTDGKLGALSQSDILDWSLVAVAGAPFGNQISLFFQGPLSFSEQPLPSAQSYIASFRNVTASPLTLSLTPESDDFDAALDFGLTNALTDLGTPFIHLEANKSVPSTDASFQYTCLVQICSSDSVNFAIPLDTGVFADGKVVPTAGAPGPIIGAGFPGVLAMLMGGFMLWRRKLTFSMMP